MVGLFPQTKCLMILEIFQKATYFGTFLINNVDYNNVDYNNVDYNNVDYNTVDYNNVDNTQNKNFPSNNL